MNWVLILGLSWPVVAVVLAAAIGRAVRIADAQARRQNQFRGPASARVTALSRAHRRPATPARSGSTHAATTGDPDVA